MILKVFLSSIFQNFHFLIYLMDIHCHIFQYTIRFMKFIQMPVLDIFIKFGFPQSGFFKCLLNLNSLSLKADVHPLVFTFLKNYRHQGETFFSLKVFTSSIFQIFLLLIYLVDINSHFFQYTIRFVKFMPTPILDTFIRLGFPHSAFSSVS
jgi:hypothetical protein